MPSEAQRIAFRFEPGAQWTGLVEQDEQLVRLSRTGYLFVVLYRSNGGKGIRCRLASIPESVGSE